jgi:formylglycine-generating enzyme required for sulfatase activity
MRLAGFTIAVAAVLTAASIGAQAVHAESAAAWRKHRLARYADFRATHPDADTEIADIKAKTAALLATMAAPRPDPLTATPTATPALERSPDDDTLLNRAPVIWRVADTPVELWDGAEYPATIVVPAGEYTMGSPSTESGRQGNEGPRHRVRIGYSFAVGKYSITVGEYARFVADTHHDVGEACFTLEKGVYRLRGARDFRRVGYRQSGDSPVGCVNWFDATAYVAWLSKKTGHDYRLLSEAEYEYLNRAGTTSAYWWGDEIGRNRTVCDGCGSAFDNRQLAPAGSFAPNPFDLYDTTGNSWSWLSDCWNANYAGAPADGSAFAVGDCDLHVMRGGAVHSPVRELRSASRSRHWFSLRNIPVGFRVARTL